MNYALDLILLCIFLLFIAVGVRKGFIRSAAHFLGAVLAACLSAVLGGALAQWVFDAMFREALVERISSSIAGLGAEEAAGAAAGVLRSLPDFIVRALEEAGVTDATIARQLSVHTGQAAELIADALSPVFVSFLKVLAVIVLYALFMMIVRALSELLGGMFRLPLLRQVNGLLGGVFGFLLALVTIWVVLAGVQVFQPMLGQETQMEINAALRRSLIADIIVNRNPLGIMFR